MRHGREVVITAWLKPDEYFRVKEEDGAFVLTLTCGQTEVLIASLQNMLPCKNPQQD